MEKRNFKKKRSGWGFVFFFKKKNTYKEVNTVEQLNMYCGAGVFTLERTEAKNMTVRQTNDEDAFTDDDNILS